MGLLQMSMAGGVMILLIAVIRALAVHRLPKITFLVLWGMTALRLLLPVSVPLPVSTHADINHLADAIQRAAAGYAADVPAGQTVPVPAAESVSIFTVIWLVGTVLSALWFLVSYIRNIRKFQTSLPDSAPFVQEWLTAHRLYRPLEVRFSDLVSSPLTYGILRPVILLPKNLDRRDEATLRYMLTHEYVHIRRFDAVTKLVFAAALCVHWFNPLVWIMYVLANRDMELSCDGRVLRILGEQERSAYALTLINMEEQKSGYSSLYSHFSKNAITERIEAIMKYKKSSALAIVLALVLVVGATTAFATSAAPSENTGASVSVSTKGTMGFRAIDPNAENISKTNEAEVQTAEKGFWGNISSENGNSTTDGAVISLGVMGMVDEQSAKTSISAQSAISYSFGVGEDKTFYEKGTVIEFTIQCVYADIPVNVSLVSADSSKVIDSHRVESDEQVTITLTIPEDGNYLFTVKNESLSRTQEYSHVIAI